MNPFLLSTCAVLLTAYVSSRYTTASVNSKWYQCIKSNLTPPNYVFPLVWSILYVFIAYAFGTVLQTQESTYVIGLFVLNLLFNVAWCYLYFYKKHTGAALVAIGIVIASIVQIMRFSPSTTIYKLMMPYLAWVTFAACLNYTSLERSAQCDVYITE